MLETLAPYARRLQRADSGCTRSDNSNTDSETRSASAPQAPERSTTSGIDPTLADLAQSPYSPRFGQGVCDLRQACGVRDMSKTVSFLGKANSCFLRLAGHVLMAVEDHLYWKGRMPADFDCDVAPFGIQNVERIVIY